MVYLHFTKSLELLLEVAKSDEVPYGIPSTTGRPLLSERANSSDGVRGGGGGPPPVRRASAFFLLVI